MKKFLELISEEMGKGFEAAGYEAQLGRVTVSNRPDLCEYQCNGAMAGAKKYHKAPIMIANDVAEKLTDSAVFSEVSAVAPGFLNLKVKDSFVCEYLKEMAAAEKFGVEPPEKKKTIVVDYGGPNVAKPLHVGHLRSAVIGESIKRINRYKGHRVIGDVHLGDWGLQMGLIITELKARKPELPYFDESFTGEYPQEAPFTVSELEEIYPTASGKSKEDPAYKEAALEATLRLQSGDRGYRALVFFQICYRKGSAVQAARIVERNIRRIVRNRIKKIHILMMVIAVKLPAGRHRDFIHFFRVKFQTQKVLCLCNRRKILKAPNSV